MNENNISNELYNNTIEFFNKPSNYIYLIPGYMHDILNEVGKENEKEELKNLMAEAVSVREVLEGMHNLRQTCINEASDLISIEPYLWTQIDEIKDFLSSCDNYNAGKILAGSSSYAD